MPDAGRPNKSNYIYNTKSGPITAILGPEYLLTPSGEYYNPCANVEFMMIQRYAGGANDVVKISTIGQVSVCLLYTSRCV